MTELWLERWRVERTRRSFRRQIARETAAGRIPYHRKTIQFASREADADAGEGPGAGRFAVWSDSTIGAIGNGREEQGGRMATISGGGYHGGWVAGAFVLGGLVGFVAGVAAVLVLNAILVAQTSYAG